MNSGKPPSRDWRAQAPSRSGYSREWRSAGSGRDSRFSRKFKLGVFAFGLSILMLLIGYLFFLPVIDHVPPTQVLAFGIGAYGGEPTNPTGIVPVNPFGEEDVKAFDVLHDQNPRQFLEIPPSTNVLNSDQFLKFCKEQVSKLDGKNLIVFCTTHALVLPSGEIKLFAIDSTPETPGKMISLKSFIDLLNDSPARHVLLVLDAARIESSWRLGSLGNDISQRIQAEYPGLNSDRKTNTEKVAILLAASPGQISVPMLGQSSLAHFLIQGLQGEADGWEWTEPNGKSRNSNNRDQRVTLHELAAYICHQIVDWSQRRYGMTQTPLLTGNLTDYDIAGVARLNPLSQALSKIATQKKAQKSPEPVIAEADKQADAKQVDAKQADVKQPVAKQVDEPKEKTWDDKRSSELWSLRDQWRNESGKNSPFIRRQAPLAWRRFEAKLALAESLKRGGQENLASVVLQQADAESNKLIETLSLLGGMNWKAEDTQLLKMLGFSLDANLPSRDLDAEAEKELKEILADPPPNPRKPMSNSIRKLFIERINRKKTNEELEVLRTIAKRLATTPDVLFLIQFLNSPSGDSLLEPQDLRQYFDVGDSYRRLAWRIPESWPRVKEDVRSGLRALDAAERWILATGTVRPEALEWLRQAEEKFNRAEKAASLYSNALGIWSDLLCELPFIAEWVATRANDDPHRNEEWNRWGQRARDGRLELDELQNQWPEKPEQSAVVERKLLNLFSHAQSLKSAVFANDGIPTDSLVQIINSAEKDRRDFWKELKQRIPSIDGENPPSTSRREAYRLLDQSWLSFDDRKRLSSGQTDLDSRAESSKLIIGDSLPERSTTSGAVWQGFWAITTLDLFSLTPTRNSDLWKEWGNLVESSQPASDAIELTDLDRSNLQKKRARLGQKIYQRSSELPAMTSDLPTIPLLAAMEEPFRSYPPESDPDRRLRDERHRQFNEWLTVFSEEWHRRADDQTNPNQREYGELSRNAESLTQVRGNRRDQMASMRRPYPKLGDPSRFSFNTARECPLELSFPSMPGGVTPTHVIISAKGPGVHLVDERRPVAIDKSKMRPLESGKVIFQLALKETVDTPQSILVVSTESDQYPLEFREIILNPPFDPSAWRIELSDAKDPTRIVESSSLAGSGSAVVYLSPKFSASLRVSLVRPAKDVTRSADVAIYRLKDSNAHPEKQFLGKCELSLTPGEDRVPIKIEFPPKDKTSGADAVDLAYGILFEITPKDQKSLPYMIRPEFYSESKFLEGPGSDRLVEPSIHGNRLAMNLVRKQIAKNEEGLLPKETSVQLNVSDSLEGMIKNYYLTENKFKQGRPIELYFELPTGWRNLADNPGRPLQITLDVAGLPHAYIWKIDSTGLFTRKVRNIEIRLKPDQADDPKQPRRKPKPILVKGKDALKLQFEVNATDINVLESIQAGDWALNYHVSRVSDSGGFQLTSMEGSLPLFSSLERHVFLDTIEDGIWNIRTEASDYLKQIPAADLRGESVSRFRVQAELMRANNPTPIVTAKEFYFAIDDTTEPRVEVSIKPRSVKSMDEVLAFSIKAIDRESGIQRIRYGFDGNDDGKLDKKEVLNDNFFDTSDGIELDPPEQLRPVSIRPSELQFAKENEEERKVLLVEAENGLGTSSTVSVPITFRRPAVSKNSPSRSAQTGSLIIKLNNLSKFRKATIKISGPKNEEKSLAEGVNSPVKFENLEPGHYTIEVDVTMSISEAKFGKGKKEVDIKVIESADNSKTVEIDITEVSSKK